MSTTQLSSREIRAVYDARRVLHGTFMTLHLRPLPQDGVARAAVVAGRRVGTAVDRNRARRRLRALLRADALPGGADVVMVAKPLAGVVPFTLLARDYRRLQDRLAQTLGAA